MVGQLQPDGCKLLAYSTGGAQGLNPVALHRWHCTIMLPLPSCTKGHVSINSCRLSSRNLHQAESVQDAIPSGRVDCILDVEGHNCIFLCAFCSAPYCNALSGNADDIFHSVNSGSGFAEAMLVFGKSLVALTDNLQLCQMYLADKLDNRMRLIRCFVTLWQ